MVEAHVHRLRPLSATIILADGGKLDINYTPAAEEQTLDKSLFDATQCMQALNVMIDWFKDQEEADREQL